MKVRSQKPTDAPSRSTEAHTGIPAIALALMTLLLVVLVLRMQPPSPKGIHAAEDQFSAGRAMTVLRELLAEGVPHPTGSEANSRVRGRIIEKLRLLGYDVEVQETFFCGTFESCAPVKNVLARLPGREAGPAVVLVAHYDSRPVAPGAADDGSGVATILEMARILKGQAPFRNPVILLFTDGEEAGLFGAEAFVAEHPWAREVGVAINLEARGTSGLSLMFETSENNAWLVSAYAASVPRPATSSLFFEVYRRMPNTTDLAAFKRADMAGLNLAFVNHAVYYHTPLDDLEHLELGSLQHQGDTALALVRKLAEMDLAHQPKGNAVYVDLLGFTVLWWPETWTVPLALLTDVLLLAVGVSLIRSGEASVRSIGWGLLAWFINILIPILLGLALLWIISKLAGAVSPWYAYPLPTRLALWSGVLFSGAGVATLFSQRARFWGLGMGTWLWWAVLSTLSAFLLPAVSVLFLVPAGVAVLALVVVRFTRLRLSALASQAAYIVAALTAGLFWMQLALLLEMVLGLNLSPPITLSLALVMSTLSPLFAHPGKDTRLPGLLLIASAGVMLVSAAAAVFMPPYSETRPQPLNIIHFEDRDAGTAHWIAMSPTGDLPVAVRQAGHFTDMPQCMFPWSGIPCFVATADPSAEPAPELIRLSEESVGGERVIKGRLRSPRGGDQVLLIVPRKVPLKAIYIEGRPIPLQPDVEEFRFLRCLGLPRDGVSVEIHLEGNDSAEVMIADLSPGLPTGGERLVQARFPTTTPGYDGDMTMVLRRVKL